MRKASDRVPGSYNRFMRAFITGASGFLGHNLLQVLLARGWSVTALQRTDTPLPGAAVRRGDLHDAASVAVAMPDDVDAVFHVAGDVSMWKRDAARQWATNVDGTRNVVEAARSRKAKRFIFTSAAGTYGLRNDVFDELATKDGDSAGVPYLSSKLAAERLVLESGLDAVIMNPGHIVGPHDTKSWSHALLDLRDGKMSGAPPGRGTFCHAVRVAEAHEVAARQGRRNQNYLLGGEAATYGEAMAIAARLVGARAPSTVAAPILRMVARAGDLASVFTGTAPAVSPQLARILVGKMEFRSDRAMAELGYEPASLEQMFDDAAKWFRSEGLLASPG